MEKKILGVFYTMGLLGFNFGKKRRVSKKYRVSKKHSKSLRKPPAKLLRLCKKYRVKATKKVGGKRHYKSVATLKKLCLRKAKALRKKLIKLHKKSMKKSKKTNKRRVHRTRKTRASMMGEEELMSFGMKKDMMMGEDMMGKPNMGMYFGKRRSMGRAHKVSKTAAMKAFRSFYKRHCAGARRTRFGFGNGGNPNLNASMGYEFCPNGEGGVLGFNSTGLYPSPCTTKNAAALANEMAADLPVYSSSNLMFGRRRRSPGAFGRKKKVSHKTKVTRKTKAAHKTKATRKMKMRSYAAGTKSKRVTTIGARRRRSTRRARV